MFTVIICDKHIIDDCKSTYCIYLKPLLNEDEFAFCEWNVDGKTLDEALPSLNELIHKRNEWRALIVLGRHTIGFERINKLNPFDYVDAVKVPAEFKSIDELNEFVRAKREAYKKAYENPLARLSIWLSGSPIRIRRDLPKIYSELPDISDEGYLEAVNDLRLSAVDIELDKLRQEKYDFLAERFDRDGAIFNLPKQIITIAERTNLSEYRDKSIVWEEHTELDYSRFYEDNLYPDKLRYAVFNIPYIKETRNELAYFNFLTTILVIAANEIPNGAMRPNRVYRISAEADSRKVSGVCNRYRDKLLATHSAIHGSVRKTYDKEPVVVSNSEFERVFESETNIPVSFNARFNTEDLMANDRKLGLSKDCPEDEEAMWDGQYANIKKLFVKFMREPKRAVKTAVSTDFRERSRVNDSRALSLNEYQREDIVFKLQDEEQAMVESSTKSLFDLKQYHEELDKADKTLKRKISYRMSKKKTIIIGAIAIAAYFMGFLPLIFSSLNTVKSFSFSFIATALCVGAFALAGLICLLILRRNLKLSFRDFNDTMRGIINSVIGSMGKYSAYLSHACNVMREFSVLNYIKRTDDDDTMNLKIMANHLHDIEDRLDDVARLFSDFIAVRSDEQADIEPYDYDFTRLTHYDYPMPYYYAGNHIEFMQTNNIVEIPVDYLQSITVEREELYD